MVKKAIERKRDCEGAYYLLCRALFAAGRYQEVLDVAETAIEASGEDYNVYVPIVNTLGALGKTEDVRNMIQRRIVALENHLKASAGRRAGAHPAGRGIRAAGTDRRRLARTEPGSNAARQRGIHSVQRGLPVLRSE